MADDSKSKPTQEELARRLQWFENYTAAVNRGVHKPRQQNVRYHCPCCEYPTLSQRGGDEICDLCNWQDDGQDDPYADEIWGGPNYIYSLSEARENFKKYLIMFHPDKPAKRIGGNSNTPHEHQAKQGLIEAFDAMTGVTDVGMLEKLQEHVRECYKILNEA